MKTKFLIKLYALTITLLFVQNVFAQPPKSIHVVVEKGLTLDIYSDRYVINYFSPEYIIETDTLLSLGKNQEILDECPNCYELPMNIEHYFSRVEFLADEYDAIDSTGYPALPIRGLNLQLPEDAFDIKVTIDSIAIDRVDFTYPYVPSLPIAQDSKVYSIVMQPYYQSDGKGFFDEWHDISDTYGFMGTTGVAFNVFPLKYNPEENYTDMITSATFTVSFNSNISLLDVLKKYLSGAYYEDALNFYDTYTGMEGGTAPDKGNYVILTHKDYKTAINDFVEYKKSIGYNVMVYQVPNDVSANKTKIRDFIKGLYKNNSTKPRFLLLVGNPTQIPYSRGSALSTDDPPTDIYYACIEKGNSNSDMRKEDMCPELYIGRWSVYSAKEVRYITQKTIKTELALYNTTKNDRHASLFSGINKYAYWFEKDVKWIRDNVLNPTGIPNTVFIGSNGFNMNHMINELKGVNGHTPFLFHYSGHGGNNAIGQPWEFSYYELYDSLDNKPRTWELFNSHLPYQPFGFGFACLLNDYSYKYNFGESWTSTSVDGGITFFGATTISYVAQNKYSLEKVFNYFKDKKNYNIAQITAGGMAKHYSSCKVIARRRQVEKYNLLGDPSALIYGVSKTGNKGSFVPPKRNYESFNNGDITVYPTLAGNFINIETRSDVKITSIYLYDMVGRMLELFDVESSMINVSHIQNGTYILQIKYNSNQTSTTKIIINH